MNVRVPLLLRYRLAKVAIVLIGIWIVGHLALVVGDGLTDDLETSDLAVILGNKVNEDGTPSARLQSRLDRAKELYSDKVVSLLLVSGGIGREGFDEAKVMADYLAEQGIPREHILVDSGGNNSFLTARYTARIMAQRGLQSVIAVTQYYHISRTKLALRKFGVQIVRGAHARISPELRDPYSLLREFVGYYYYLFRAYD